MCVQNDRRAAYRGGHSLQTFGSLASLYSNYSLPVLSSLSLRQVFLSDYCRSYRWEGKGLFFFPAKGLKSPYLSGTFVSNTLYLDLLVASGPSSVHKPTSKEIINLLFFSLKKTPGFIIHTSRRMKSLMTYKRKV